MIPFWSGCGSGGGPILRPVTALIPERAPFNLMRGKAHGVSFVASIQAARWRARTDHGPERLSRRFASSLARLQGTPLTRRSWRPDAEGRYCSIVFLGNWRLDFDIFSVWLAAALNRERRYMVAGRVGHLCPSSPLDQTFEPDGPGRVGVMTGRWIRQLFPCSTGTLSSRWGGGESSLVLFAIVLESSSKREAQAKAGSIVPIFFSLSSSLFERHDSDEMAMCEEHGSARLV
ncbi:hypothetical protein EV126DRAFT_415798 [Verticillium dahliae]|nr:hypothetical protein EV126DRAFT_415798 [Verticillium dahliae]